MSKGAQAPRQPEPSPSNHIPELVRDYPAASAEGPKATETREGFEPAPLRRAVALTFDCDAMSLWIGGFGSLNLGAISRGEFETTGLPRVLNLLDAFGIRATFFVPGHTALAYPALSKAIADRGHEVGHHGFVHERIANLTLAEERTILLRGLDALMTTIGARPVGYRSPSWEITQATIELLSEHDFLYDSSLMATDFYPYWARIGDSASFDDAFVFGDRASVVELPVSWLLDDFPHFEYVRGIAQSSKSCSQVYEIWWAEFEYFAREVQSGCFTLTLHPQVIGRGSRIDMLQRLIAAMAEAGDIEFLSLSDVATRWRVAQAKPLPERARDYGA